MFKKTNMCIEENSGWVPEEKNLGEFILNRMKLYRNNIAMIHAETGESVTYGKMLHKVISVAKTMKSFGLGKNDIISVCSNNSLDNYVPVFASFLIGVKPASLDPTLSLDETIHLINLSKPKLIFCEEDSLNLIEQAIQQSTKNSKIVVIGNSEKHLNYKEFLNCEINEDFEVEYNEDDDTAMILFSSGSTGLPKGICVSHYGLLFQSTHPYAPSKTPMKGNISYNSTYWIGATTQCLSTLAKGSTYIACSNFQVKTCLEYIQKYKMESIAISTAKAQEFIENAELSKQFDVSSLMFIYVVGEPFGETQLKTLYSIFPQSIVANVYGITETSGTALYYDWEKDIELKNRKGNSAGKPVPGFQMKVVDLQTQKQVSKNEPGELRIKTKTIMTGYYGNKEEYDKQFDEEGYFCTGDVAYFDEDNWFYIVDRIKEVIKYRGWHVVPVAIESVLLTHPSVKEAVVVGIPDVADGEHPVAVIVLKENSSVSADEIVKFVEERVSDRQKLRGGVKFIDNIPRTASGKAKRLALRQMIQQ